MGQKISWGAAGGSGMEGGDYLAMGLRNGKQSLSPLGGPFASNEILALVVSLAGDEQVPETQPLSLWSGGAAHGGLLPCPQFFLHPCCLWCALTAIGSGLLGTRGHVLFVDVLQLISLGLCLLSHAARGMRWWRGAR